MSTITLHPTKGVNPHLTTCPRCGGDGRELIMLGHRDRKIVCDCGWTFYGVCGKDTREPMQGAERLYNCPHCKQNLMRSTVKNVEISEHERLPGGLCDDCEKELAAHNEIVEAGGVHFRCKGCGASGVVKATSDAARAVREKHGEEYSKPGSDGKYKPCGVEFQTCPNCEKE